MNLNKLETKWTVLELNERPRNSGDVGPRVRLRLLKQQNFTCAYCTCYIEMSNSETDHFIPYHICKHNQEWNLFAACKDCNQIKYKWEFFHANEVKWFVRIMFMLNQNNNKKAASFSKRLTKQRFEVFRKCADMFFLHECHDTLPECCSKIEHDQKSFLSSLDEE